MEVKALWGMKKVTVTPVVIIGALGSIMENFEGYMKQINMGIGPCMVQKTVLLGSARILRRVLEC